MTGYWQPDGGGAYAILRRGDVEMHFFAHPALDPWTSHAGCYWRVVDADAWHRVAAALALPDQGIPRNPGAWLMAIAKRRAVDHFRRAETLRRRTADLGHDLAREEPPDLDAAVETWKASGGDELRAFYQDILDQQS